MLKFKKNYNNYNNYKNSNNCLIISSYYYIMFKSVNIN